MDLNGSQDSLAFSGASLLAIIALICLSGLILFLFKKDRLTAFAIFWLLGNLVVESTFIPLELIFEHRVPPIHVPHPVRNSMALQDCYT